MPYLKRFPITDQSDRRRGCGRARTVVRRCTRTPECAKSSGTGVASDCFPADSIISPTSREIVTVPRATRAFGGTPEISPLSTSRWLYRRAVFSANRRSAASMSSTTSPFVSVHSLIRRWIYRRVAHKKINYKPYFTRSGRSSLKLNPTYSPSLLGYTPRTA
jgi:hypothetical protein